MVGSSFPYAEFLPEEGAARGVQIDVDARMIGLRGIRIETPEDVGPAWEEALAANCPVVIEALTDPEIAALPPHITLDQARSLTSALLHRDPDSRDIIRSLREKLGEMLPHRS